MQAVTATLTPKQASIVLHDTLAHDDAPSYSVWLQKGEQFRKY